MTAWLLPIRFGVVVGESMAPAFRDGQVFLMWRLSPQARLRRGDVVVFHVDGEVYLKRVRALAGERLWGLDWTETEGRPDYLAFSSAEADYLRRLVRRAPALGHVVELRVPEDSVFLVGDEVSGSYDSRHFGPVPLKAIKGRVVVASVLSLPAASSYGGATARGPSTSWADSWPQMGLK